MIAAEGSRAHLGTTLHEEVASARNRGLYPGTSRVRIAPVSGARCNQVLVAGKMTGPEGMEGVGGATTVTFLILPAGRYCRGSTGS